MATDRFYICTRCQTKTWIPTLFDALRDQAEGVTHSCQTCSKGLDIELHFSFGMDAGRHPCKVLEAYLPDDIYTWCDVNGNSVEFYPFMVIVESMEEGYSSVWLPYWHLVNKKNGTIEKKYGQWAPFIDLDSYASLLAKARAAGYFETQEGDRTRASIRLA